MIGNAQWTGTKLADLLRSAGVQDKAVEVVFYGADQGEDVANRGAPYEVKYTDTFARSMPIAEAMNPANILCYQMNGAPLPSRQRVSAPADCPRLVWHRQCQMAHAHRGA